MPRRLINLPGPCTDRINNVQAAIDAIDAIAAFIRVSEVLYKNPTRPVLNSSLVVGISVCGRGPIILTLA